MSKSQTGKRNAAQAAADVSRLFVAIDAAIDLGTVGTINAYALAGIGIDETYELTCAEAGKRPVVSSTRTWSDVSSALTWDGKGSTRSFAGRGESTVQRAWKIGHHTTATRGPVQWHAACDRAAKSDKPEVRDHPAYKRTRMDAYVQWVAAKARSGGILADGTITPEPRSTGAAPAGQTDKAREREVRISEAARAVELAAAPNASAAKATAPIKLAGSATLLTASDLASMSEPQLRELSAVIKTELDRRKAVRDAAKAAKDVQTELDAAKALTVLADAAKARNRKGTKAAKVA